MSLNVDRLAKTLQRELSLLLMTQAKDDHLSSVTITEVRVTKDLSFATVYYIVPVFLKDKADVVLQRSKGFLKKELSRKVKARKMPELLFKYDEALEYGNHINEVLNNIK
ncbi:MAG: 30S ribosome-binding factor RbfA [bacterium]